MTDAALNGRLREYLRELKPEARALLASELERAMFRGEGPPGASSILEALRSDARRDRPQASPCRKSAAAVLHIVRALPRRRCADAQASRPHFACLPRSDLGHGSPAT